MIPSASDIARRRHTVTTIIRACSLVLLVLPLWPLSSWITEGLQDGDLWDFEYYLGRIILAVLMPVAAVGLFITQGLIVKLLVPIRRVTRCPACRHRIEGLHIPRCTECGLDLTPEYLDITAPREVRSDWPARVLDRREIVASVLRLAGVFFALFGALMWTIVVAVFVLWVTDSNESVFESDDEVVKFGLNLTVLTLFTALLLFKPRWVARFVVPGPKRPARPDEQPAPAVVPAPQAEAPSVPAPD